MCFPASDPSWAPAWPSSWPRVPVACRVFGLVCLQLCRKTSTFFVASNSTRSTCHRRGLAKCLHRHLNILLFQTCGIALLATAAQSTPTWFVNLHAFVSFRTMLHLLANPGLTFFCKRFCCLPMNSNVRTRSTTDRHTILSQVCPRDAART